MSNAPLSTGEREDRLLDAFVQLADTLVDDYDMVDVLHELVSHCVRLLDAAAAGIVLSDQRGNLQVLATSTEQTRMLELYQLQTSEDPCWDCVHTGEPVSVADLGTEVERWPLFAGRALDDGFAAVHAIPMRLRRETIGALNLFSREPGPMPENDLRVARALADTATIGILQERAIHRGEVLTEQLQVALSNRIIIEQAKGVLAHADNLDMDDAFQVLRSFGRRRSARLSDVSRLLVTGAITARTVLDEQNLPM
ncbi:GAF and ANTAR domain-containing protein [Nocardia sp. NPDC050712]|uniref:GAF and ANTAR domain-containing protein n=1 Tax=Nocardia sp. NPDC050712 TaxID=3155518 RepID=UPI0033C0E7C4